MSKLKNILFGLVVGVAIGMWLGINIGRGVPLYSNPFDTDSLKQEIKRTTGETLEKGGQTLEKTGQALQEKLKN